MGKHLIDISYGYPDAFELIIGVMGTKGSGKSEVSQYLINQHSFMEVAFADLVKKDLSVMTGIPLPHFYPRSKGERDQRETQVYKFWNMTIRQMMQKYGTDAMRNNFHPDFWIKRLDDHLRSKKWVCNRLVISDVRYVNEAQYIRDNQGHLFKVWRDTKVFDTHSSEIEQGKIQPGYLIDNRGELLKAYDQVDRIIDTLTKDQ